MTATLDTAVRDTAARDALRREIAAAFAGRPYPGDDAIALRQPGCPGDEGEAVWRFFAGKDWRSLLDAGAQRPSRDQLAFLTSEGFVYFLPAFLTLALDVQDPLAVDEGLVFRLWSSPEEVASRLGPAEKRAVVHCLEYLAGVYGALHYADNLAGRALDEYWAYFTDQELGLVAEAPQASEEASFHALSK